MGSLHENKVSWNSVKWIQQNLLFLHKHLKQYSPDEVASFPKQQTRTKLKYKFLEIKKL